MILQQSENAEWGRLEIGMGGYRDLVAWQKSMDLTKAIYQRTRAFPREETYGLTSQMRRCAVSVPSNIAEGYGRLSRGELVQFLGQARGSLFELETQILLSSDLSYLSETDAERLLKDVGQVARMLSGLLKSTRLSSGSPLGN